MAQRQNRAPGGSRPARLQHLVRCLITTIEQTHGRHAARSARTGVTCSAHVRFRERTFCSPIVRSNLSLMRRAVDAVVSLRDVQEAASHADPRTTMRYDRARQSLDRHATYVVAAFVAGAAR
jgi:hypothetical protein